MTVKPLTQSDIVKHFQQEQGQESGTEKVERIRLPGIAYSFERPKGSSRSKETTIKVPDLKNFSSLSFQEIAHYLSDVADYKLGVTGFEWSVGNEQVKIWYIDGYEEEQGMDNQERETLTDVIANILRCRANIVRIKWEFGNNVVELTTVM
jgi:hypothetical protein